MTPAPQAHAAKIAAAASQADALTAHVAELRGLSDCAAALQARFSRVDDEFRSIMLGVGEDPRVFSLLRVPQLSETLAAVLDQLERCQKALADFLEEKRQRFPRFYFIGDDDLLEILGHAKTPAGIQSHLKKLFAGIISVKFPEGNAAAMPKWMAV